MKNSFVLLLAFFLSGTLYIQGQNYEITFGLIGDTGNPDSVKVENLTRETEVILTGGDVLHLVATFTGIDNNYQGNNSLMVYPNPMSDQAFMSFYNPIEGGVSIEIFSIDGKRMKSHYGLLPQGTIHYELSGFSLGTYILNATTQLNKSSALLVSNIHSAVIPEIKYIGNNSSLSANRSQKSIILVSETIEMKYEDGEELRFSAYLNNVSSVKELIIDNSQILTFGFAPAPAFTADKTIIAIDSSITFTDNSLNAPTSWNWDFGDGNTSTEQNPDHAYNAPGLYTVSLSTENTYGINTLSKADYIDAGLIPETDFSASDTAIAKETQISFTDHSTNNPDSWFWDFGDGNTSTEQNPSHTYTEVQKYTVSLTATNKYGENTESKSSFIDVFITDIDNNKYSAVQIGSQVWMTRNLRTTKLNDGSPIPKSVDVGWDLTTPVYGWENNDSITYAETFGALYNFYAINTDKLCPAGWHVPDDAEWQALKDFVTSEGHEGTVGTTLKTTSGWVFNGSNEYGFSAIPTVYGDEASWWSSLDEGGDHANYWCIDNTNESLTEQLRIKPYYQKTLPFSVRCVKD